MRRKEKNTRKKGGLTRNDLYDTICMTLIRFLYDLTNLNV